MRLVRYSPHPVTNPMADKTERKRLSDMRATAWCITMWLTPETGYTPETINEFVQNMPNDWSLEGQMEQGHDSGKLHYQLLLKTPQTRGTRVQKYWPKCYIDEAHKFHALKAYVHKTDTRVAEFKTIENRSPQWSVVCDKFFDWVVREEPQVVFFGQTDEERLRLWDKFIGISIEEGMRVDIVGVNPQYRSCILRYWTNYLRVAQTRAPPVDKVDRQTDRQNPPTEVAEGGGMPCVKKRKTVRAHIPKE